jgi:hypothetical protein
MYTESHDIADNAGEKKTTDQKAEEPGDNIKQTSGCVSPEEVNSWPNYMLGR